MVDSNNHSTRRETELNATPGVDNSDDEDRVTRQMDLPQRQQEGTVMVRGGETGDGEFDSEEEDAIERDAKFEE